MFAQAALLFFALTAHLVSAATPACLIEAVSNQTNPADIKSVCSGSNATSIEQYLCQNCGSNAQLALSSFASACSSAGVTLSTSASCSNNSSSSSSSGMASSTVSGHLVTAVSSGASGRVTATVTGSPNGNNTLVSGATPTAMSSGAKASGGAASATASAKASSSSTPAANTGAVARLSMDCLGLLAVGMFGAMMAL